MSVNKKNNDNREFKKFLKKFIITLLIIAIILITGFSYVKSRLPSRPYEVLELMPKEIWFRYCLCFTLFHAFVVTLVFIVFSICLYLEIDSE